MIPEWDWGLSVAMALLAVGGLCAWLWLTVGHGFWLPMVTAWAGAAAFVTIWWFTRPLKGGGS